MTKLNPYLNFNGNAREAIEFYKSVFGGKLVMNTFKEFHASHDSSDDDKIMHSMLETNNGMTIMAADIPKGWNHNPGENISISLSGENDDELTGYFNKLSVDGTIHEALKSAPWGDKFGMLLDKFGIRWMVNINVKKT